MWYPQAGKRRFEVLVKWASSVSCLDRPMAHEAFDAVHSDPPIWAAALHRQGFWMKKSLMASQERKKLIDFRKEKEKQKLISTYVFKFQGVIPKRLESEDKLQLVFSYFPT